MPAARAWPCVALVLLAGACGPAGAFDPATARDAFERGRFGEALAQWQAALPELDDESRVAVLLDMASAYRALGRVREAARALERAGALAQRAQDRSRQALALGASSDVNLLTRRLPVALDQATRSVELAREAGDPVIVATTLNQRGNVLFALERYSDALEAFAAALSMAERTPDAALVAKIRLNLVHAHLSGGDASDAVAALRDALASLDPLPPSHAKLQGLLAAGHLAQRLDERGAGGESPRAWAYSAFTRAVELAQRLADDRAMSYAYGHLGELYAAAQRYAEADSLFDRALFHAARVDAPELVARWRWRKGRLLRAQDLLDEAIAEYREALGHLRDIQPSLLFGIRGNPQTFRTTVGAVYLELAELLLGRADAALAPAPAQDALRQIRQVMEEFKAVELENYFRDDCVSAQQEKNRSLELDDLIPDGTATLYPVVFEQRLVLLLSHAGGRVEHFIVDVTAGELESAAVELRTQMNPAANPRRLLRSAQSLYDWLIRPIEAELESRQVQTLVIVPDGILRTIPFAALHDGRGYLVSRYALAITPGLSLTDPSASQTDDPRLLLAGLSQGVQGFEALPHVSEEIDAIASVRPSMRLLDESFSKRAVIGELERTPYSAISFATHGRMDADPSQSFVLTHDGRLTLDELERFIRISEFRDRPVELLVLSACDTAVGDERAALGLAGVALKAGARSAMASLWSVNDRSTAELVPAFFSYLNDPEISKARALQLAQRKLLADPATEHPFYWAAFILIGNWL